MIARVESHNKELNQVIANLHTDKETLHLDLKNASDQLNSLEDKLHKAHQMHLELLKEIKDDEEQIRDLWIHLRDREEIIKDLEAHIKDLEAQLDFYRR